MLKAKPIIFQLNLHLEFFDKIATGEQTFEFRDRADYWVSRVENRDYDFIRFRNGYGP